MHSHASPLEPAPAACRYLFCPSPQEYLLIGRHLHHDSLLPARGTTSKHAAHEANAVVAPDPELEGGSGLHPIAQLERATPHVVRVEREDHVCAPAAPANASDATSAAAVTGLLLIADTLLPVTLPRTPGARAQPDARPSAASRPEHPSSRDSIG